MIQSSIICDICGRPIIASRGGGRLDFNYWDDIKTVNAVFLTQNGSKVYDLCSNCRKLVEEDIIKHKNIEASHKTTNC